MPLYSDMDEVRSRPYLQILAIRYCPEGYFSEQTDVTVA